MKNDVVVVEKVTFVNLFMMVKLSFNLLFFFYRVVSLAIVTPLGRRTLVVMY